MKSGIAAMPGNERMAQALADLLDLEVVPMRAHELSGAGFYVAAGGAVGGRRCLIACTLDRPGRNLAPLSVLASSLRLSGASSVGLVAPYLAVNGYSGALLGKVKTQSAESFAGWISGHFDWLVTADPNLDLHRIGAFRSLFSIPTRVVHVGPEIARWIEDNVAQPLLIGVDPESAPWIVSVANAASAPYTRLSIIERGDCDVEVSLPNAERWRGHTPVLVDTTLATPRTTVLALNNLTHAGFPAPVCVVVHPVFGQTNDHQLRAAGAAEIVSANTVLHPTNRIDLTPAIGRAVQELLQ
jgi:ribose-phosphate pyrophosphokinase